MIVVYNDRLLNLLSGNSGTVCGMAVFPLVIIREDLRGTSADRYTVNHEMIHIRQQLELLLVFFVLWYILSYYLLRVRGCSRREAYMGIRFEREAYSNMYDLRYLGRRRPFSFLKRACLRRR